MSSQPGCAAGRWLGARPDGPADDTSAAVQRACVRAGAAAALLQLLGSSNGSAAAQEEAATALHELAGCHAAHRRAILDQPGSIQTLQQLMTGAGVTVTPQTAKAALTTPHHLTFAEHNAAVAPTVPAVLQCLSSPHAEVVRAAAALLADLARFSEDSRHAIAAAGGVPALAAVASRFGFLTP